MTVPNAIRPPAGAIEQAPAHDGSHTYVQRGQYSVRIVIRASTGEAAGVIADVRTFAEEITITRAPQLDNSISHQYPRNSEQYIGAFADTDPAPDSAYSATINWGDGTQTAGRISRSDQHNFAVAGTHDYESPGTYPLSYTITKRVGDRVVTIHSAGDAIIYDRPLTMEDIRPYNGLLTRTFDPAELQNPAPAPPPPVMPDDPVRNPTTPAAPIASPAATLFATADVLGEEDDLLLG